MPDLTSQGVVLYGRDSACLDDQTAIAQEGGATIATRPIAGGDWKPTAATHGCSILAASHGRALAHLVGYGLFDALSGALIDAAAGIAGDYQAARGIPAADGTIALTHDYGQSRGLRLLARDGSAVDVDTWPDTRQTAVLDKTRAVWRNWTTKALETCGGLPVPQLVPDATAMYWPNLFELAGKIWIAYHTGSTRIVVHPIDALEGYSFPAGFYLRARAIDDKRFAIVWASDAADNPADGVHVIDVTATPATNLGPASVNPQPGTVNPPPSSGGAVSSGTPHALPAHPRKLWLAPFFSISTRYGDTPRDLLLTYANAVTIVPDAGNPNAFAADLARAFALGLPIICGAPPDAGPIVAPYIGNIIAWWVSGTDAASLSAAVAIAAALSEKPIVAYLDSGDPAAWPASRPAWVSDRVWPAPQCYRLAGEAVDAFAARMHAMLSRLAAYGVYSMLTPRFDDVNGTQPVSFTTEAMPVYAELLQAYPLAGAMPFADRRGHGISADAELLGWAQAFARANVARPNRYDYWTPSTSTPGDTLKNKLAQSIEMVVLSVAEKQFLLGRIG